MNSFDFSTYDNEDLTPPKKLKQSSNNSESPNKKDSSKFDFGAYDYSEYQPKQAREGDELPENFPGGSAPWYEKFGKSLSVQSQFGIQPKSVPALTKSTLSGATFGGSELIPGLDLTEENKKEYPELITLGDTTGSLVPFGKALKVADTIVKKTSLPIKTFDNFLKAFVGGSLYESGKQAVKGVKGEGVDFKQIPKTGAEVATVDSFFRGLGALGKKFLEISPLNRAQILEKGIIPEGLPKSQYETAEEILQILKDKNNLPDNFPRPGGQPPPTPPPPPGGGSPPPGGGPPNNGRPPLISPNRITNPQDIGLRPVAQRPNPSLPDRVGEIFSQNRFYNSTQGGHALRNEIMNIDEDVYRGVNELYGRSRELNSGINEIHPQLAGRIRGRLNELEAIPEPSDVQRRVIRASNNILERLASFDENGHITGYLPINNQILIDQIQSLRQIIDYDFAHGNTKNIFRPLINDLQESVLRAAEGSGNHQAAEALNEARGAYRAWVEAFDNDYVRPFRDASNQDLSKLFKGSLDLDESTMLRNILGMTERGTELANASTREIVEKHLSKYFENPRGVDAREFSNSLRELEAVITPEQATQIREQFAEAARPPDIRATKSPSRQPTNDEVIASRYEKNKPEDIQNMMNSRSGIKQLRKDLSDTKGKKEVFERLTKQKMRSILREGNIEKNFTGDDLYKFLNKEKNFELFSEFLGEAETEALRQSAKEIGKSQIKKEVRNAAIKKIGMKAAGMKTFEIILNLL